MNKRFYSNCYEEEETLFFCYVEGMEEGAAWRVRQDSEDLLIDEIEGIGGEVVAEDAYLFENDTPHEVHHKLIALGYDYMGPVDDDALDTSS